MRPIQKPEAGEYIPYTINYMKLVPDNSDISQVLRQNLQHVKDLINPLSEEQLSISCAEDEWTIKEILIHIIDTERIFAYRALRFARNDTTELAGFEQDDYVAYAGANERSKEDLLAELTAVRMATIALCNSLREEALHRSGISSGHKLSVRAALYIIAGHELYHLESIKENYLSGL